MARQYPPPVLLANEAAGGSVQLERVNLSPKGKGEYDEAWLQSLLFTRPELLPIEDISRSHSALIPLCREMETGAGPIDLVYVNEQGMLTLVECKLWRNPEARREVVGQILEYAAHLAGWAYHDLRNAVAAARRVDGDPICDLVESQAGAVDARSLIDDVQRCLEEGRFLLLIVGDGIRRNVQSIAEMLRQQAGLSFTFGLVELSVFRLPSTIGGGLLVQPRILSHSVEIVREIARQTTSSSTSATVQADGKRRRIRLSDMEIRERLGAIDPNLPDMVYLFLEKCRAQGLQTTSRRSLMVHHVGENGKRYNLGTFYFDGDLNTNYIASDTEQAGDRRIGELYLKKVAELLPGAMVLRSGNSWTWRVVVNGQLPRAIQLLQRADDWLAVIVATREALRELENRVEELPA